MVLSDVDILRALETGQLIINPKPDIEIQLGPCSLDFHLGNKIKQFTSYYCITPGNPINGDPQETEIMTHEIELDADFGHTMYSKDFILASTLEHLEIGPELVGRLEGRSSLARLGLAVHSTAGRFDPGWSGIPTLELLNSGPMPIRIKPGMRICAFTFSYLRTPASVLYKEREHSKYINQSGPIASRIHEDRQRAFDEESLESGDKL